MPPEQRRDEAVEHDEVCDLAPGELLQRQRPQRTTRLAVEAEGDPRECQLEQVERGQKARIGIGSWNTML